MEGLLAMNIAGTLALLIGLIFLVFALPELIAQIVKITIKFGPITYGPLPKVQIGSHTMYFKGKYWYVFITFLFTITIIGIWLTIWGICILS